MDTFSFKTNQLKLKLCARIFLLPHSSDDGGSKSLRRAFVTLLLASACYYMRLLIVIYMYPILLGSCPSCPIVKFQPSLKFSLGHKAEIRFVMS